MTWKWDKELENEVLEWLAEGKTLTSYCQQEGKPSISTVNRHIDESPEFDLKCIRAREVGGDVAADKLAEINQALADGTVDAYAAKIISSNLQWMASKLMPRRYGDAVTLRGDKNNPLELALATRLEKAERSLLDVTPPTKQIDTTE